MDAAINQLGALTSAQNASSGTAYRCPICRVRVIYAAGPRQSPHFRHSPRTLVEEQRIQNCPNYVADQGGTASGLYHGRIAPPPPPPRPRLAVGWVRSAGEAQCWSLLVAVPVPSDAVSVIRIDDYVNGNTDIPWDLVLRNRQFFVRAHSRQYQVIGYDQTRHAVWYPEPTDPLTLSGLHFFRAGANGGLQLNPDEPLVKGRTYFVLSRIRAWTPPPSGLYHEVPRVDFSDPQREWLGFLVYLPRGTRTDVKSWCSAFAERELVDPPCELDLVLPPALAMQPDGAYRIAAGEEVVLALRGGDWIEPMVEVVTEETGRSQEWELEVEAEEFVRLGKFAPGMYTVHLRDWALVSLRLAVVEARSPVVSGVELRTATLDGATEFRAGLLDPEAAGRWQALFSGRELWRGIELPDNWPVSLSWSAKGVGTVLRSVLTTPEAVAGAVSECLAGDPNWAALDGGVFGKIIYQQQAVQTKTTCAPERLPADVCSRLRWLIVARASVSMGSTAPLAISIPIERTYCLREPDRRLVKDFLEVAQWPVVLLPQARAVGQAVARRLQSEP
jgi:hypothetical protein